MIPKQPQPYLNIANFFVKDVIMLPIGLLPGNVDFSNPAIILTEK